MSAAEIHTYQYLWDASQPGWVLTRLNGNYVDLSLKFEVLEDDYTVIWPEHLTDELSIA